MLRQLHRWLGLVFSLFVLAAAGSGILHNVMTMTQASPPPVQPGGEGLKPERFQIQLAAAAALPRPLDKIEGISVRVSGGEPWFQFYFGQASPPEYVNALTGIWGPNRDETYAAEIASSHLGGQVVKRTDYLKAFNYEYLSIFRILPVYRFEAEDGQGTRVYVSTMTGSVTRATDDWKQSEANIFSLVHKFAFIPNKTVRNVILTTTTTMVALVAVLGVILFWRTKG